MSAGGTGKVQAAARRESARTSLPCPALWLEPAPALSDFPGVAAAAERLEEAAVAQLLLIIAAGTAGPCQPPPRPPPLKSRNNNHSA